MLNSLELIRIECSPDIRIRSLGQYFLAKVTRTSTFDAVEVMIYPITQYNNTIS